MFSFVTCPCYVDIINGHNKPISTICTCIYYRSEILSSPYRFILIYKYISVSETESIEVDHSLVEEEVEPRQIMDDPLKSSKRRKQLRRTRWTTPERECVETHLRNYISKGIVPGKLACEECKRESKDILEKRDWKNIKYYAYHRIVQNQKWPCDK